MRTARAGDENWDNRFYVLSASRINALATDQTGQLFIGGTFSLTSGNSGVPANNIAGFDGQNWFNLGLGIAGAVNAIACNGNDLYVGGAFTSAGGVAATNLARWDGTNWWAVGGGVLGTAIKALTVQNGVLFAGGTFTNAGGAAVQNLAAWDGQSWSSMNGGLAGPNATVNAFLPDNGRLIVGGRFQTAGGTSATNIAAWSGSAWSTIGNGLAWPAYVLTKDTNGTLYAGGGQSDSGPPYISRWDGLGWSNLPAGSMGANAPIPVLFVYANTLYAGGLYSTTGGAVTGLNRFDGTNWTKIGGPFYPVYVGPVMHQGKLCFAGRRNHVMAPGAGYGLAEWDGTDWTVFGAGIDISSAFTRSLTMAGEKLIAGGRFYRLAVESSSFKQLIASWDQRIWSEMGSGITAADYCSSCAVLALATNGTTVYAASSANKTVQRWDGTNWTVMGSPLPATPRVLATRGTEVFAGGDFGALRWDGSGWSPMGSGVNGSVYAMAARSNDVFVGGSFSQAGGTPASNIARWDGTNWSALAGGLDALVGTIAFRGSDLIAGGSFTNAGLIVANCIALWDGTNWSPLGAGFSDGLPRDNNIHPIPTSVNALAVNAQGVIYAAGNFTKAGGVSANFISFWDGGAWQSMGSGLNLIPYALALHDSDLYVGGDFTRAGQKPASRIALWHGVNDPLRPFLHARQEGQDLILWWPTNFSQFILESAGQLPAGEWSPITSSVVGDQTVATNPVTESPRFFRLRKP